MKKKKLKQTIRDLKKIIRGLEGYNQEVIGRAITAELRVDDLLAKLSERGKIN